MQVTNLTVLLSQRDCIDVLNANFINPIKASGAKLVLELPKGQRLDFGGIGIAYEYWVRCQIRQNEPKLVESFLGYQICCERYADRKVLRALEQHSTALRSPARSEESNARALAACLFFAKFETEYRSRIAVESIEIKKENVAELDRLASVSDLAPLKKGEVTLHPIFAVQGSKLKIEADGDLIVETTLVDLKTSSKLDLKDNLRQLIGYVTLNDLGSYKREINAVGVYYPRFKYFVQIPMSQLATEDQFENIKAWFAAKLGKNIRACK